jgi:hypothetical protein
LDEIIQLNGANRPQISTGPFGVPYISSMSHDNGGVKNLGEKIVLKSKESPLDDDERGVGSMTAPFA